MDEEQRLYSLKNWMFLKSKSKGRKPEDSIETCEWLIEDMRLVVEKAKKRTVN